MNTDKVRELTGLIERIAEMHYDYTKGSLEEKEMLQPKISELLTYVMEQLISCYNTPKIYYYAESDESE